MTTLFLRSIIPLLLLTVAGFPPVACISVSGQETNPAGAARLYIVDVREDIDGNIDSGSAAYFRVIACGSAGTAAAPLGIAPVEEDGSVFVRVPAMMTLRFEVLDAAGAVLAESDSAFEFEPGSDYGLYRMNEQPGVAPPPPVTTNMPIAVTSPADTLSREELPLRSGR